MSRSRKKVGIYKTSDPYIKRYSNKATRRINKVRVQQGKEPKIRREVVNDWDLYDWVYKYKPHYDDEYLQKGDIEGLEKMKRFYFGK